MRGATLALCLLTMVGCSDVYKATTPDGTVVYSINCTRDVAQWDACYNKAELICGPHNWTERFHYGDQYLNKDGSFKRTPLDYIEGKSLSIHCNQ